MSTWLLPAAEWRGRAPSGLALCTSALISARSLIAAVRPCCAAIPLGVDPITVFGFCFGRVNDALPILVHHNLELPTCVKYLDLHKKAEAFSHLEAPSQSHTSHYTDSRHFSVKVQISEQAP